MMPWKFARLTIVACVIGVTAVSDGAEIQNVVARQRYPWNGMVDVTFEIVGDVTAGNANHFSLSATDRVTGSIYVAAASALSGDIGTAEGVHHVIWDMSAQGLTFKSPDVMFKVSYTASQSGFPLYCVIDLSAGAYASSYPVTYMDTPPSGGFNTDEYKTTKLVLRRIDPGSFKMCGSYDVTLTKPFYCGIFEVTQRQYELVTGNKPSYFNNTSYYATRPVEKVSYNMIRGSSSGANWPSSSAVDADSFMGKLRARTGITDFDLPTEAQWEYACRAGTTSQYNNGGDSEDDLNQLGRHWDNGGSGYSQSCSTQYGTAAVGSYQPNAWGLYDMHGNVGEWCLDWTGGLSNGATDPKVSSSGSYRVARGGSWSYGAGGCTSSFRDGFIPSYVYVSYGFRLVRTLSE